MKKTTTPPPTTTKQSDQQRIEQLEKQNQELTALVEWYQEQFRLSQAKKFGSSSEKTPVDQMEFPLFNEAEITASPSAEEPDLEEIIVTQKKRKERKTNSKTLPVEIVPYTLSEEERVCSCCGDSMHVMSQEVRREIMVIPAEVKILEHVRDVFACRRCEKENTHTPIVKAPMPNPVFLKSMASPSAVAHVITQKYMAAVPLYRQERQFQQLGLELSRQTMSNWILNVANEWLDPLKEVMKDTLLQQSSLHSDETTLQVLQEKDRPATTKSYMWLYRTGNTGPKCVIYDYQTTRAAKHPQNFLKNVRGFLHADGYKGYDGLSNITISGCWAHARRKFDEAQKAAPPSKGGLLTLAEQALQKINALYKIEKQIVGKEPEERLKVRQEQSIPLVEAFFAWLRKIKPEVLPKGKLGEAIQYALNQQKKLEVPFSNGELDIDNNRAERAFKPFVVGRKNWLFSTSSKGAKASATIYSIMETAKENNLHVFHYFVYLLETLPNIDIKNTEELKKLVPWSKDLPANCYLQK